MSHYASIPTEYKGIRFRSRLEAKWAIFFDAAEWKWQYEPCDFAGWIPDFVIYGKRNRIYVEVKPTSIFPVEIAEEIDSSGCTDDVVIVGDTCPLSAYSQEDSLIRSTLDSAMGWIRVVNRPDRARYSPYWAWKSCLMTCVDKKIGFGTQSLMCDEISGSSEPDFINPDIDHINTCWAKACNGSQWRSPT